MLRIPSDKDRKRRVKKYKGGFDDSWYDDKAKDLLSDTHSCHYCGKPMKPINRIKNHGEIIMTCDTDGCPGNYALDKKHWDKQYKPLAESLDRKLLWEFADIALDKPWRKLWGDARTFLI